MQYYGKAMDKSSILIYNSHRLGDIPDVDKEMRFIIYMIEKGRKLHYEKREDAFKITVIFDRRNVAKLKNQMVKLATKLTPILQAHYPETLSRMYIFPTDPMFTVVYKMCLLYVDKETSKKIHYCKTPAPLREWMENDQIYDRYGGQAKDAFDEVGKHTQEMDKTEVLKSAAYSPVSAIEVEQIWEAPIEFQDV
jgi:hypothetical protein